MNDFLQNLRSGKDKRYERGRRPYINPQFRENDWRNGNDHKKSGYRKPNSFEQTAAVKSALEDIAKNQERFAIAVERVASAIEVIAEALKSFTSPKTDSSVPDEMPRETASVETSTTSPPEESEVPNSMDRDELINIIVGMRENGATYGKIAEHLDSKQIATLSGKGIWSAPTVHRLYRQHNHKQ
jgi:hypothetical protein